MKGLWCSYSYHENILPESLSSGLSSKTMREQAVE